MIGYFGDIIFETSDKKILNFSDFKKDVSARYESHDLIGQKPKLEFVGSDLDKISFTINLNSSNGISVKEEIKKLEEKTSTGKAETLVIGGEVQGSDKWIITSLSEAWDTIFNDGFLYSAKIDVSLEEYISE